MDPKFTFQNKIKAFVSAQKYKLDNLRKEIEQMRQKNRRRKTSQLNHGTEAENYPSRMSRFPRSFSQNELIQQHQGTNEQ